MRPVKIPTGDWRYMERSMDRRIIGDDEHAANFSCWEWLSDQERTRQKWWWILRPNEDLIICFPSPENAANRTIVLYWRVK